MPLLLMAASKPGGLNGKTPLPQIAPSSTELITLLMLLRNGIHVEEDEPLRLAARELDQPRGVGGALPQRALLHDRVGAVRGGDQRGPLAIHQAALDRAARLDQLGSDTQSTSPGTGISAMIGSRPSPLGLGAREELQIVDRGARALRDARHGCRLHQVSLGLGDLDQPFGEHTAALAAERRDRRA